MALEGKLKVSAARHVCFGWLQLMDRITSDELLHLRKSANFVLFPSLDRLTFLVRAPTEGLPRHPQVLRRYLAHDR